MTHSLKSLEVLTGINFPKLVHSLLWMALEWKSDRP